MMPSKTYWIMEQLLHVIVYGPKYSMRDYKTTNIEYERKHATFTEETYLKMN